MNAQSIKEAIGHKPFLPFVLRTGDDREYPVRSPEMVFIFPSGRTVLVSQGDDSFDLIDTILIASLHYKGKANGRSKRNGRGGH